MEKFAAKIDCVVLYKKTKIFKTEEQFRSNCRSNFQTKVIPFQNTLSHGVLIADYCSNCKVLWLAFLNAVPKCRSKLPFSFPVRKATSTVY